eukprot:Sspe_Gene.2953::Locus_982_Transcript_1_1_Confidence_1.000_Length_661::g.2953::m.2953
MSATCIIHNKSRTVANLEEAGNGTYKCKQTAPCKSERGARGMGIEASGHMVIHPEKPERCQAHGKVRSPQQLWQVMTPHGAAWECIPTPEAKCKLGRDALPTMYPTSQLGFHRGHGYHGHGADLCVVHRKKRAPTALEPTNNGYRCKQGRECKVKANVHMCHVHSKERKLEYLELDPVTQKHRCKAGMACQ